MKNAMYLNSDLVRHAKDNRTNNLSTALENAYKELNSLQEKTGVEMQISIGFTGVKVKSLKDNTLSLQSIS